jgi:hypothetical protein
MEQFTYFVSFLPYVLTRKPESNILQRFLPRLLLMELSTEARLKIRAKV